MRLEAIQFSSSRISRAASWPLNRALVLQGLDIRRTFLAVAQADMDMRQKVVTRVRDAAKR